MDIGSLLTRGYEMKWISVKERLPEVDDIYLVCDSYHQRIISCFRYKKDWISCTQCMDLFRLDWISHWMPLPPAPEEERASCNCITKGVAMHKGRIIKTGNAINVQKCKFCIKIMAPIIIPTKD